MVSNIDCLINILSHLSVRDRQKCRQVCNHWKSSSDHLSIAQKELKIVSRYQSYRQKCEESPNTIVWPKSYIKYDSYCDLMQKFPNLKSISFIGFDHWSDPLIHEMSISCPLLNSIEFIACDGLGNKT
jgi:hypothetical protein